MDQSGPAQKHKQYESICRRCGECCREKVRLENGRVVYLDFFCPALDVKTKKCRIYKNRHAILPAAIGVLCLSIEQALRSNEVPSHCEYRKVNGTSGMGGQFNPKHLDYVPRVAYLQLRMTNIVSRKTLDKWLKEHTYT